MSDETLKEQIEQALQKDFNNLLVKEFTTDWKIQRLKIGLDIEVMDFDNLMQLIKQDRERAVKEAPKTGAGLEIDVPKETMQAVFSRIKLKDKTVAKRVFEAEWRIERFKNGTADKYDLNIEIWKLRILAQMAGFNLAVFLLRPKNLDRVWSKKALAQLSNPAQEKESDENPN